MANVLVTGGTGFIGSHVARNLLKEGHRVVCFDTFFDESRLSFIGKQAIFFRGDVTRIEEIISAVRIYDIDRIIALAFLMTKEAEEKLQLAVHINALGVNNVFEAARLCGIKRVIYSSSIGCYGNFSWYGDKPASEVAEDFRPANNVYGAAKQFNEFMAMRYNKYHQMEIVCIRVSVVFGYGRATGSSVWIDDMVSHPVKNMEIHIPQKSSQKVNLIYVKDLARIFSIIVNTATVKHYIYNTGGYTVTLKSFADIVMKYIPNARIVFDENAPPYYIVNYVDNSRIRQEFDFEHNPLEDSVMDQIRDIRQCM
jgi:UDP-glucose 4-epimerase